MRLLKTAVFLFLSIISVDLFAAQVCQVTGDTASKGSSPQDACSKFTAHPWAGSTTVYNKVYDNNMCGIFRKSDDGRLYSKSVSCSNECPPKGSLKVFYYPKYSTSVPTRVCDGGCTYEGGHAIDTNNFVSITMQATGDSQNCTNESGPKPPPTCDKTDPYGGCYVPPNDNCMRLADGSIQCPDNEKPPENNTCNGADYCKRPPQGCGAGYVPGSFNGQQLCVRSGPNKPKDPPEPDKPDDPNNCMNGGSYCPQPPDNTKCPSGYYETTYNGSKICVKDNPDPEKPNPNDPTGGKGPDGGDGGGGDGSNGGTGSINLKPVIDAINALKTALLNALAGFHPKLDKIINGVNQGLEKLDKSNEHLDKIEDATQATSEAVGESNKKLDGIKDAVESIGKCKNPNYDPTNLNSVKYFDCTANDLGLTDSPFQIKEEQITDFQREDHIRFGQYCPYSRTVEDIGYFKFEKDLTFICEFGKEANPYIRAIGYLGALIYLLIALRSRE
ncbi:hypothetical protein KTH73_00985 [Acinetobacter courvalinii]|uniref:hypothetical protein n=1 Tax=Acinetobacter courvalinii TaxID=280147 RepID=UPI0021CD5A07|nr:hypothetical protein [Acinetobacter courvalinii]MCU4389291.1 hypothetical protein [Acinetobacter courvalinii]